MAIKATVVSKGAKKTEVRFSSGKTYGFYVADDVKDILEEGKTFHIETKEETGNKGYKYKVITKAVIADAELEKALDIKHPVAKDEKMSKEDWAKKDAGIKWQCCLKAAAVFHAQRVESNYTNVLADAKIFYVFDPERDSITPDNSNPLNSVRDGVTTTSTGKTAEELFRQ